MLAFLFEYRALFQNVAAWAVCLAALRWGGGPERWIAIVWLFFNKGVDRIYHTFWDGTYRLNEIDVVHGTIDTLVAIGLIWVALRANRMYPLWLAAFQLIAVASHLVRNLVEAITPIAYAVMALAPSHFVTYIFIGGLIAHIRRKKRYGPYRDWRQGPVPPTTPLSGFAPHAGTLHR
jgi:hypothetical protein